MRATRTIALALALAACGEEAEDEPPACEPGVDALEGGLWKIEGELDEIVSDEGCKGRIEDQIDVYWSYGRPALDVSSPECSFAVSLVPCWLRRTCAEDDGEARILTDLTINSPWGGRLEAVVFWPDGRRVRCEWSLGIQPYL